MTLNKTVALVGMMGAGKTSIGKRLAARLDVPFADADHEIEAAADMTVAEIFAKYGEPEFRRLERSVIARLLGEPPHVLATGGGAFMDETTRAAMKTCGLHHLAEGARRHPAGPGAKAPGHTTRRGRCWPMATCAAPWKSCWRCASRPMPLADMVLESGDEPHAVLLDKIVAALAAHGLCEGA